MRIFRKTRYRILLIILLFLVAGGVSASEILNGEACYIEPDRTVEGDLFAFCGELRIEGTVTGSVLGAARSATISGDVQGSVYIIGGELIVSSRIGKDVHFAGLILTIEPPTRFEHENGSIISLNLSNTIQPEATVPGAVTDLGYQLIINGEIGGEVNFWGSALNIDGDIEGDVKATVGNTNSTGAASQIQTLLIPFPFEVELVDPGLIIYENGYIAGSLEYRGPTRGRFRRSQIEESAIYHPTGNAVFENEQPTSVASLQRYLRTLMREFGTLAFVSLLLLLIIPRQMQSPLRYMQARPVSTFGVGLLSFIMSFPIVLIMALFSIFIIFILSLLPINTVVIFGGVVLGLANIGAASIFYFTAIYVARVVVALAMGRIILRLFNRYDGSIRALFFSLMLGNLLLALATTLPIPIVGWGINALAAFLGLGAILTLLQAKIKAFLESAPNVPNGQTDAMSTASGPDFPRRRLPYFAEQALPPQAKPPDSDIGMQNLPRGFDWWGQGDAPHE